MEKINHISSSRMSAEDSNGNEYSNLNDMWKKELDPEYIQFEKDVGAQVEGERIGGRE